SELGWQFKRWSRRSCNGEIGRIGRWHCFYAGWAYARRRRRFSMSDLRGDRKTLDVWREPVHGLQVVVESWRPLCRADDQFIARPRDLRLVWHYLKRVAPLAVLRKVRSRLAEGTRNRKVAAVGSGTVRAAPDGSPWR